MRSVVAAPGDEHVNECRIPARVTLLKPVSAAISIGTGGPFGA